MPTSPLQQRVLIAKAKPRKVRTPGGQKKYGQPIGTIITADMVARANRIAAAARSGAGGGNGTRPPAQAAGGGRGTAYDKRFQYYRNGIKRAGNEKALEKILERLENDSLLDEDDYDKILDRIETRADQIARGVKAPDTAVPNVAPETAAANAKVQAARAKAKVAPPKHGTATRRNMVQRGLRSGTAHELAELDRAEAKKKPAKKAAAKKPGVSTRYAEYEDQLENAKDQTEVAEIQEKIEYDKDLPKRYKDGLALVANGRMDALPRRQRTPAPRGPDSVKRRVREAMPPEDPTNVKAAKAALIRGYKKAIAEAKGITDLGNLVERVNRQQSLSNDEKQQVYDVAAKRAKEIQAARKPRKSVVTRAREAVRRRSATWSGEPTPAARVPKRGTRNILNRNAPDKVVGGMKIGALKPKAMVAVIDVQSGFQDEGAVQAMLKNDIKPGAGLIVAGPTTERAWFSIQVAHYNSQNPKQEPIHIIGSFRSAREDWQKQILSGYEDVMDELHGPGFVIGLRNPGQTVVQGAKDDVLQAHIRRGKDTKGNEREALVIQPGYRGGDDNAFGLNAEDLAEAGTDFGELPSERTEKHNRLWGGKKAKPGPQRRPAKPEDTPAGRDLAKGVDIDQLKNPEGLWEYLQANPDRYGISEIAEGLSDTYQVTDRDTGKLYFFKRANNGIPGPDDDGSPPMHGDGINEVMAARLGRAAFPDIFPNVDFAELPDDQNEKPLVRMDHVKEIAKNQGHDPRKARVDAGKRWEHNPYQDQPIFVGEPVADPRQALAIHIFDYLIDQTDRHPGNYGFVDTPDGAVLIPLDNGAAFYSYNQYLGEYGAQVMGMQILPDKLVYTPDEVGYAEWADAFVEGNGVGHPAAQKGHYMVQEAQVGYENAGAAIDQIQQDAEEIIEEFRKINIDKIMDALQSQYDTMAGYEKEHIQAAIGMWKARIQAITAEDVVEVLSR